MKFIEFRVEGSGPFPTDMLRYDQCWPATSDDAVTISNLDSRDVLLMGVRIPVTEARWRSFGWRVVEQRKLR